MLPLHPAVGAACGQRVDGMAVNGAPLAGDEDPDLERFGARAVRLDLRAGAARHALRS